MKQARRTFLRATMAAGTVAVATSAGLLSPRTVLAAWPKNAFEAKKIDDALQHLVGSTNTVESDQITVEAPDIAENGAVVSVSVKTTLPDPEQISVLVPKNTSPLCSSYMFSDAMADYITGRIKMRESSDVVAVVKSGGKLHTARKPVKVTLGGCGG